MRSKSLHLSRQAKSGFLWQYVIMATWLCRLWQCPSKLLPKIFYWSSDKHGLYQIFFTDMFIILKYTWKWIQVMFSTADKICIDVLSYIGKSGVQLFGLDYTNKVKYMDKSVTYVLIHFCFKMFLRNIYRAHCWTSLWPWVLHGHQSRKRRLMKPRQGK